MIDIKQAIKRAKKYAVDMLEVEPNELLLEEIRWSKKYWDITLSFNARLVTSPSQFDGMNPSMNPAKNLPWGRESKSFHVNKSTGEVEGIFNVEPVY